MHFHICGDEIAAVMTLLDQGIALFFAARAWVGSVVSWWRSRV